MDGIVAIIEIAHLYLMTLRYIEYTLKAEFFKAFFIAIGTICTRLSNSLD